MVSLHLSVVVLGKADLAIELMMCMMTKGWGTVTWFQL